MKNILNYNEAVNLCNKSDSPFYEIKYILNNYKISSFTYRLASEKDFRGPGCVNMRGITYIFDKNNTLKSIFLMLPKFFNINKVETTQYHIVKDKTIKYIAEKEDGSLIAFMILPDNETIFAKTIGCFDNDQTAMAMTLLKETKGLNKFVLKLLKMGYTPLFEYVSKYNKIVLTYSKPELRFIGLRDNLGGRFISSVYLTTPKNVDVISTTKVTNKTLDELIELAKTIENKEGWVVEFSDGQLIKIKTEWYMRNHYLRDCVNRENDLIYMILSETIDELISQLDENDLYFKNEISKIQKIVITFFNKKITEINNLLKFYNGDKKDFAVNYKNDKDFHFAIKLISNNTDINILIKQYLLAKTKKLNKAREFIDRGVI